MMNITCIIVDDEFQARQNIRLNLEAVFPQIRILAEAEDFESAISAIAQHHPDIVFLDIDLGKHTGFDILRQFPSPEFQLIFITGFSDHAIHAFRVSAVDYLLKPVDPAMLKDAVGKAIENIEKNKPLLGIQNLISNYLNSEKSQDRIVLHTAESVQIIEIHSIIRCEASSNYTYFFQNSGNKIIVSKTLKEFEESLTPYGFSRVHQSHLVNFRHVKSFEKKDGGFLLMSDKSMVPVASRKRDQVLDSITKLGISS